MKSSQDKRVTDLEQRLQPDGESVILVTWSNDEPRDDTIVTLTNGVKMTYAEYCRRYPESKKIELTWGDDDTITVTE